MALIFLKKKNEGLQCAMRILVVFQIIVQYPRDTCQVYTIGPRRGPRYCGVQDRRPLWPSEDRVEECWCPLLEPAVPVCWISLIILFAWRNLQFGLDVSAEVRRPCCKLRTGSGVKVRWGLTGFENWQWGFVVQILFSVIFCSCYANKLSDSSLFQLNSFWSDVKWHHLSNRSNN